MSFGFPAYFTESRTFNLRPEALVGAAQATLNSLGWRYEAPSANELRAKTSMSVWSWGENLQVWVSAQGEVRVDSRCAYPLQCIDWGKNEKNVRTFFARFEEIRASSGVGERPPAALDERGLSPVGRMLAEEKEGSNPSAGASAPPNNSLR